MQGAEREREKIAEQYAAQTDYKAFEEEHSGTYVTKEQLREMYERATGHKYGFLYYRPRSGDVENMFYANFTTRLLPS